jgi:hypothetical protein
MIKLIEFQLNSTVNSEIGYAPFDLVFGQADKTYFQLPDALAMPEKAQAFLTLLNENLQTVRAISKAHHETVQAKRMAATPAGQQNTFHKGDFVLQFRAQQYDPLHLPNKLAPTHLEPFEVLSHRSNYVTCRHLHQNLTVVLHSSRLKLFAGTEEVAKQMALLDDDQYEVDRILAYVGEPDLRSKMMFKVRYADGDELWIRWSQTEAFEKFCQSAPHLHELLKPTAELAEWKRDISSGLVQSINNGDKNFVDLRLFGSNWAYALQLPRFDSHVYMVEATLTRIPRSRTKVYNDFPIYEGYGRQWDDYQLYCYGSSKVLPENAILVDDQIVDSV